VIPISALLGRKGPRNDLGVGAKRDLSRWGEEVAQITRDNRKEESQSIGGMHLPMFVMGGEPAPRRASLVIWSRVAKKKSGGITPAAWGMA